MTYSKKSYATPQEEFWAGEFGNDYITRNMSPQLVSHNIGFFARALRRAGRISSCIEFGANIGLNLKALQLLYDGIQLSAVEINSAAAKMLAETIGENNVFKGSILEYQVTEKKDLCLTKGVLIHIRPDMLVTVYEKLYQASNRFILICEYYNPSPVVVSYRGHSERLFKRDFAGEMLDKYSDLELVDYGFVYHRDPAFPQDDISWFLMRKS